MLFKTELSAFLKYFYKKLEIFLGKIRWPLEDLRRMRDPPSNIEKIIRPPRNFPSPPQHMLLTPP